MKLTSVKKIASHNKKKALIRIQKELQYIADKMKEDTWNIRMAVTFLDREIKQ